MKARRIGDDPQLGMAGGGFLQTSATFKDQPKARKKKGKKARLLREIDAKHDSGLTEAMEHQNVEPRARRGELGLWRRCKLCARRCRA